MTADQGQPGGTRPGDPEAFALLDAKLNVFALANGMDLEKAPSARRLTWYRDRMERAIVLEVESNGSLRVDVKAWETGDEASARKSPQRSGLEEGALAADFTATFEQAIEAANAL